jgi:hypothetical protein
MRKAWNSKRPRIRALTTTWGGSGILLARRDVTMLDTPRQTIQACHMSMKKFSCYVRVAGLAVLSLGLLSVSETSLAKTCYPYKANTYQSREDSRWTEIPSSTTMALYGTMGESFSSPTSITLCLWAYTSPL